MARNTFATFGILAVLLLGIGIVSAGATENNFSISIEGPGISQNNPAIGEDDEVVNFTINFTNNNVDYPLVNLSWEGVDISSGEKNDTGNTTFVSTIIISSSGSSHGLKVYVKNSTGDIIATLTKPVYYSSTTTPTEVLGCTDSEAINYNSEATIGNADNDSCTYTSSDFNFCSNGKQGYLEIADVEFTNLGEGEDDDWFLLDEVEIEVEIENTHSTENVRNVMVEIMILDSDDNDVTSDFEFDDEEINLNTIKDDDSEYVTFRIDEIPADLDSGWYSVYIKAYSEDDENEQCVAEAASKYLDHLLYQRIEVTREEDPAVIMKGDTLKISASCGDNNVALPLSIYNLGSDKEKKVLVTLYNSVLELDEKIVIDNLKSGKRKEITFYFDMPQELSRETYTLDIVTYYDYDDDEEELELFSYSENSEDDLDEDFSVRLEVLSCRGPTPTINANLDSAAEIGTDLVVKAIITNNGDDNDFVISVSDFESWADLVSVTPQTASIDEGEFIEVTITLKPKTAGTQSFKINAIVDGDSYDQSVSVSIAEKAGIFSRMSDAVTYTIIGIIALIVLIFLVLIAKVSRRPAKPQF